MRGFLYKSAFILVLLLVCGRAGGEARFEPQKPPETKWQALVEQFAAALVVNDHESVHRLIADHPLIAELDLRNASTMTRLLHRAEGGQVVGVLAYPRPPGQLASEIVETLRGAAMVPQHVREWMVPADESAMRRANATAVRWVSEAVGATERCPVGVILLWCPVQSWPGVSAGRAKEHQLLFVLVKGAPGQPERISGVAFGNPHPAVGP
jgi:hypothetical protein